jgi:hypothetical protein
VISAAEAVVWIENETYQVRVLPHGKGQRIMDSINPYWCDPIGCKPMLAPHE